MLDCGVVPDRAAQQTEIQYSREKALADGKLVKVASRVAAYSPILLEKTTRNGEREIDVGAVNFHE